MKFYQLDIRSLENELETNLETGITDIQAAQRIKECGYNVQKSEVFSNTVSLEFNKSLILIALSALIYVLFSIFLKDYSYVYYAVALSIIAMLNYLMVSAYGTYLKKSVYDAYHTDYTKLSCIRNGEIRLIPPSETMYGDIVFLKKGDYIPFDARILETSDFYVDESSIGGENTVQKAFGIITEDNVDSNELYNTVFCGSYVETGNAKVVVTDIGKRVYVTKSFKKKRKKIKVISGLHDFSKMLSLLLCAFTVFFSLLSCIISKNFISLPISVLIWISLFFSDFLLKFIKISFVNTFYRLRNKGIFLKNASSVDAINNADVLLIGKERVFSEKVSLTGIVTEKSEFFKADEINKSNFGVVLYSAFCDDKFIDFESSSSYLRSAVKLMKSIQIDYADIESVCPVISRYDFDNGIEMCGRVYDSKNMLIARGDYKSIIRLCQSEFDAKLLEPLIAISSEIIAVAIKNVEIIPDDLSEEKSGFRIIGFIGVFNSISKSSYDKYKVLDTPSIVLYPGNKESAELVFGKDKLTCISLNDISDISAKDLKECDIICDYDGDISYVTSIFEAKHIKCAFAGNKTIDSKNVSIKTYDSTPYDNINADVVLKSKKDNIASIVNSCSYCFKSINKVTENLISITAIFIICSLLFAVLNKSVLFNPVSIAYIVFLALPIVSFCCLKLKSPCSLITGKVSSSTPIRKNNIISVAVALTTIVAMVIVLRLCSKTELSIGMVLLTVIAYLPCGYYVDSFSVSKIKWLVISFIPFAVVLIILLTPASFVFGVLKFKFWMSPICLLIGIAIRILSDKISVSVKN